MSWQDDLDALIGTEAENSKPDWLRDLDSIMPEPDATLGDAIKGGFYSERAATAFERASKRQAQIEQRRAEGWEPEQVSGFRSVDGQTGRPRTSATSGKTDPAYGLIQNLNRQVDRTTDYLQKFEATPRSAALDKVAGAETLGEAASAFFESPVEVTGHALAGSAWPMAQTVAGSVLGSRAGLPGAMLGAGAASARMEYNNKLMEEMGKKGYDLRTPAGVRAAISDTDGLAEAHEKAIKKAGVVGAFDAASMGIAGKALSASPLKNAAAQTLVQSGFGMAGEAGGQLAAEGQIDSPGEVLIEGIAELPGGVVDTTIAAHAQRAAIGKQIDKLKADAADEYGQTGDKGVLARAIERIRGMRQQQEELLQLPVVAQPHPDDVYMMTPDGIATGFAPAIDPVLTGQLRVDRNTGETLKWPQRSSNTNTVDTTSDTADSQVLTQPEPKPNAQIAPETDNSASPIVDDKVDGYEAVAASVPDSGFETDLPEYLAEQGDVGETNSGIDSVPVEPVKPEQKNEDLSDGNNRNFGGAVGTAEDQQYRDGSDAGVIPGGGRVTGGDNQGSTGVEVSDGVNLSDAANTRVEDDSLGFTPRPDVTYEMDAKERAAVRRENKARFVPTHELPDGTPVIAHPEDVGVWIDSKGDEYEDNNATPLAETTEGTGTAPAQEATPIEEIEPPTPIDAQGVHAGVLLGAKAEDGVVSENPPDAVSGGFAGGQSGGGLSAGDLADDGGTVQSGTGAVVIGKNAAGEDLFVDDKGVRYIQQNGVRINQKVELRPTREGMRMTPVADDQFEVAEKLKGSSNDPVKFNEAVIAPFTLDNGVEVQAKWAIPPEQYHRTYGDDGYLVSYEFRGDALKSGTGFQSVAGVKRSGAFDPALVKSFARDLGKQHSKTVEDSGNDTTAGSRQTGTAVGTAVVSEGAEGVSPVSAGRGKRHSGQHQQRSAPLDTEEVATGQSENVAKPQQDQPRLSAYAGNLGSGKDVERDGRADTVRVSGDGRTGTGRAGASDAGAGVGVGRPDSRSRTKRDQRSGDTDHAEREVAERSGRRDRPGDGAADNGLTESQQNAGFSDSGADKRPETVSLANTGPGNYHISDPKALVGGTPIQRFNKNVAAIELFNTLRDEGRQATRAEQDVLAAYTGWGSFGQELFQGSWQNPQPKKGWEQRDEWLRDHLAESEWKSMQRSITNAHYTDPPTVQAMWQMVRRMGFKGGRILEPSVGIGNFFGLLPPELKSRSQLAGVELDEMTGGMAQQLYPDANIKIMGYQSSKTPDNFYDVVIGNWPFENTPVADRRYNRLNPMVHDYFFLKTIDQVRPGGIVIGITSKGSLDKKDAKIRRALAKKAELVAAFRLPSGAFQEYAGTKVVTDIVVLRKRESELGNVENEGWIQSREYQTAAGEPVWVNEYYHHHPDHVVGTIDYGHGTTFSRPGLIVHRPQNMQAQLDRIAQLVPEGVYIPDDQARERISYIANHTDDREGALTLTDNGFHVVRGEYLAPAEQVKKYRVKSAKTTAQREDQLKRLIDMRKAYGELIDAERAQSDSTVQRKHLKTLYDEYVAEHGGLLNSFGLKYLKGIDDPFYPTLAALEVEDQQGNTRPAQILTKSTMRGRPTLTNPTIKDAFVLARNQSINPTLAEVAELAGKPKKAVKQELIRSGAVFEMPSGDIEAADIYLSGNVREKLRQAKAAVSEGQTHLQRNVDELTKVLPPDIPYFNIEVQLGATWVPIAEYKNYIAHMLGRSSTEGIEVAFKAGRWKARLPKHFNRLPEAQSGFGTKQYDFSRLVNAALGNQVVNIRRRDSDGNEYVDYEASKEVNDRIAKMREAFGHWLWSDPVRRDAIETEYNEVRNSYADPKFDGSFLSFEGMALSLGNGPFNLREHQANAIWRALVKRKSINAHEVGTGKTFTIAGIALESRRYGIAKKPLIFGHNANSKSLAAEIQMMYPAAKVLYIDNLSPKTIDIKLRQIANDDWDAIVVPHSIIDKFTFREDTLMQMAQAEIDELEAAAREAAEEDGANWDDAMLHDEEQLKKLRSHTAKDLVKMRNRIIANIEKQAQRSSKENAVAFEDLGVDMVLVDEAHEFKKPPFSTKMKMKGLQTQTSARSIALKFITQYVRDQNNGGNVHTFTGTPVTNTLTEVYHQMRYIMDEEMEAAGVSQWDGWFNSFAKEVEDVELNAAAEYESVVRLAGFINVPELRRMVGQYMDTVFADDMPEMQPRQTDSGKTLNDPTLTEQERAQLLNGRTENSKTRPYKQVIVDTVDLTPEQKREFENIQQYARDWRNMDNKQKREAMLKGAPESPIIYEQMATKASFDVRLLKGEQLAGQEGKVKDHPDSKASRVVRNVKAIYDSHPQATQVIFTQMGISKVATRKDERFKVFSTAHDIIERLVQQGIPREQIALVDGDTSKGKRKDIAEKMNAAEIRVVIGSTQSLGVGVNMQKNLRAMHHMDAPWMPGDLEQRNGRGHRQGNQWNTVLEYRYITDRIDGRRWQVLAVKQRFINSFLKAADGTRVIEGDAATDEDSDILSTFAEAAGDPRLLIREKLRKKIASLQEKERQHGKGIADATRQAKRLRAEAAKEQAKLNQLEQDGILAAVKQIVTANAGKGFNIKIGRGNYNERKKAKAALDKFIARQVRIGDSPKSLGEFGGYPLLIQHLPFSEKPSLILDINGETFVGDSSIASLENKLRRYGDYYQGRQNRVQESLQSAERAEQVAQETFRRSDELKQAQADYQELEQDLAMNPVPPPAWLRTGAPVDTHVFWQGESYVVTGHRWTDDGWFVLAADDAGRVVIPYKEAMDEQGMALYEARDFEKPEVQEGAGKRQKDEEANSDHSIRFSRDPGSAVGGAGNAVIGQKEAGAVVERFRRLLGDRGIKIKVVDGVNDLPVAIHAKAYKEGFDPAEIRGVHDDDVVYIVRSHPKHTSVAAIEETLFHEVYGHAGFRRLFQGSEIYKQFNMLFSVLGGKQKIIAMAEEHGYDLQAYWDGWTHEGLSNTDKRLLLVDELLAHLSQAQANQSFTQKAKRLLKEFVGTVRQWLRDHGLAKLSRYNDADVLLLLKRAREAASRPKSDKDTPQFFREPMFSRDSKTPPSEGFSDSDTPEKDADLWAEVDRAAPKEGWERKKELLGKSFEWVKNHAGEFSKRGFLPLLTLRQLAEVAAERAGVSSAQAYMARVEQMLTRRNQMQDDAARLAQRWMALDKGIKHRLAWVMHESTKTGVDPSEAEFQPATVSLPGGVARIDAELAEDFNAATAARMAAEADPALNEVLATAENLQKLNRIKLRYQKRVKALAGSSAKRETFELAKQVAETAADEWRRLKNAKLASDAREQQYPKLARWFQQLPTGAQQIFREARDLYELRFNETQAALEASIEKAELAEGQKKGLLQRLRADFEAARVAGVYFPLFRQGEYFVFGERAREFPAGRTQYRRNTNAIQIDEQVNRSTGELRYVIRQDGREFTSLAAAQQAASTWASYENAMASLNSRSDLVGKDLVPVEVEGGWILEDNPVEKVFSMVGTAREAEQLKADWEQQGYQHVRHGRKSEQKTQDDLAQVSAFAQLLKEMEQSGQGVSDEVYQAYLAILPDLSMRKHHIHRKGTAGYAEDALQAFSHSMMHQAHQISKLEARDDLKQVLEDVEVQVNAAPDSQALLAGNVREELKKRHNWVMNPTNAQWTNWTSSFGFFMYLGVSPAAALVNLTQTAVVAYPTLAAEFGWAKASKALARAASQLNMHETFLGDDAIGRVALTADERTAFADWHDAGVIDKSMAHMLAGIGDSDSLQNSPTYQKWMGRTAHLFHKAEIVNREVTLLAGYRLARTAGKSHEVAVKMAADMTWSSQFDYSNANRAGFMQSNAAKLLLMFKSYSQHMIYFMLKNAADWGKGREAKKARARLLGMLGVTLAMGGVSALPVGLVGLATGAAYSQQRFGTKKTLVGLSAMGGLVLMASLMWDDDEPFDWETETRAALRAMGGDGLEALVFRGALNAVTGVNVSSRISLDDLVWRDSDRELGAAGEKGVIYENLAGPVVGYGINALTTVPELWSQDHEWRAAEKFAPKFVRDVMRTLRYGTEGALNYRGDEVVGSDLLGLPYSDDLNMWNLLWQASGFGAEKLARRYQKTNDLKNYENYLKQRRTRILTQYYQAYIERDQEGMQAAIEAARAWNKANPLAPPIDGKTLSRSLKTRLRYRGESVNGASVQKGFRYLLKDLRM